jgi:hypothetical protein
MLSMTAWQDKGSMMGGTTTGSAITAAAAALETLVGAGVFLATTNDVMEGYPVIKLCCCT